MLKPRLVKKLRRTVRFWNACSPLVTAFCDWKSCHLVSTDVSVEYSASSFKVHFYPDYKSNTLLRNIVTSLPYRSFHIHRCENFWFNSKITRTCTHTHIPGCRTHTPSAVEWPAAQACRRSVGAARRSCMSTCCCSVNTKAFGVFTDIVNVSAFNRSIIKEQWIENHVTGSGCNLIWYTIPNFTPRDCGKPW